jgi:2-oxoisovalerate dehydrogenase E2 component (dihydrolipoyl transacylase)
VPADAWVGTPRPRRVSFGIASDASAVDSGPVAYEFKLPDLGEGLTEGEIARWLVAEGQEIGEDDPLVEIQTDKTTVEIPSPAAGKVARILVAEGETVAVGTVLVVIGEDGVTAAVGEQPRAEEPPAASAVSRGLTPGHGPPGRVRATPLVRRLAQELGVDLEALGGSGPQGRVTEEDVRSAAVSGGLTPGHGPEGRRERLRGVRKLIAEHMARAHAEVPAVTWVEECDFGAVDLKRLVAVTLKAVAEALEEVPELNARLEGDEIVYLDRYDLGVAVQTDQGLVVPVVRDCDSRSVDELADEVARLAESARAHKLKPEELRGSTFTVTSAGKLGGLLTTPIVNHPEVGILSIGRVAERPVVRGGEIVARPTGTIAVTFDHRVVDGARAAEFGLAVIGRLEAGG